MSSNYHEQSSNNKHHYKSHRENNAKNKFVIYVEKKQGNQANANPEPKPEIKQEEMSKESKKVLIEKALESYEKQQEKILEKSEFFQNNKDKKNIQNYQKKNRNQRNEPKPLGHQWTNENKNTYSHSHHNEIRRKKDIRKDKILQEFEKLNKEEKNERMSELEKSYPDCFTKDLLEPENFSKTPYNIKDVFSRSSNSNQQEFKTFGPMHQNKNNNDETLPEWATYDINDFKSMF